ncbi:mitochondrial fission process protein 1 [Orussus abietinus]|uniref:mitochondrial fission process protein 1 n=1 Tax=Orussus abietinus TaxID=222816 RepID=UPI000625F6B6|nr:mitochondrial fission process protein 1 [Orussus abietinus]
MNENVKEKDLYRDTSVRYLGYTNEVGEAFRCIVPKPVVWLSYIVASGYVLADTIDKGLKAYRHDSEEGRNKRVFLSMSDTLLWQSFASVIIPGITINRLCASVRYALHRSKSSVLRSPWISTAAGLISIPVIIHPIDLGVEEVMNLTFRQWTGYHPHKLLK